MAMIVILDFGSQYTQLIARRVREQEVFCEILPCTVDFSEIEKRNPAGLILSGGPSSVYDKEAPVADAKIFDLGVPILGICYGMQWMAKYFGAHVKPSDIREYGHAEIHLEGTHTLFSNLEHAEKLPVFMSHGDSVDRLGEGFERIASSRDGITAAIVNEQRKMYGLQFHPEVHHTPEGHKIIHNFLFKLCHCQPDWDMGSYLEKSIAQWRQSIGDRKVILGLSGGVDSTVAACLLQRAIGDQLTCIFINNGLLRLDEEKEVVENYRKAFHLNLVYEDASALFLDALKGVTDPEKKRKIIGGVFIDVFDSVAKRIGDVDFLAQGTLYPDVIESVSFKGPSVTIKSHHNVGGLPARMKLKLVEPLRELFKDEVRQLGRELQIPEALVGRHPFPGPGLAVRILGDITAEKCQRLKQADAIYIQELRRADLYDKIWQAGAILLPVRSVGVMGDGRTYENAVALRAVNSVDGMTASVHPIPYDVLNRISSRIINEVSGINRVVYDISSKPPATIEWE